MGKNKIKIELAQEVTFINKASILKTLDEKAANKLFNFIYK
jgi:hypothetical protein